MNIHHKILEYAGHDAGCATRQSCPTNCSRYRLSRLRSPTVTEIERVMAPEHAGEALITMLERDRPIPQWVPDRVIRRALGIDALDALPAIPRC